MPLRIHHLRRIAAALLLLSAAVAPAASAAGSTELPSLTLLGDKSATVEFELAADSLVRAENFRSEQFQTQGNGRLVGLAVNRVGAGPAASLFAFTANFCAKPGCRPSSGGLAPQEHVTSSNETVDAQGVATVLLPAGRYAATLIADGAPAEVTLWLSGLKSDMVLRPQSPSSVQLEELPSALPAGDTPAGLAYSAGKTYTLERPGYVAAVASNQTVAGAAQVDGTCVILGPPPPGNVYAPQCPTLDISSDRVNGGGLQTVTDPQAVLLGSVSSAGLLPAGRALSIGQYLYSAVPVTDVRALQMVVQLPQGSPATAPPPEPATATPSEPASVDEQPTAQEAAPEPVAQQLPATGPSRDAAPAAALVATAGGLTWLRRQHTSG